MDSTSRRFCLYTLPLALGLLLVAFGLRRIARTPEWTVLTGTETDRQTVCRSVYKKPAWRAAWALRRLLADPSPWVRLPAIEALARRPDLHAQFAARIRALAHSDDRYVRARAVQYLFQHDGSLAPGTIRQALADLDDDSFRDQHPELLTACLAAELDRDESHVLSWALALLERNPNEDCRPLQTLLRFPNALRQHRGRLVECLDHAGESARPFLLAALTAVDGRMRGMSPADWHINTGDPAKESESPQGVTRFTAEAEWAHRVHPNFQIDRQQGELCLLLGEGAGGDHFWRRHKHSTVDIGKASFVFTINKPGRYQIWCRCWFSDKCGNHSLLHIDDRWLQWQRAGEEDRTDPLQTWHWKRLETHVRLTQGQHTLTLTAGDDGLLYDRLAVLPVEERFDPEHPPPMDGLFDSSVPSALSISLERQAQSRGTTQAVAVWVRRNSTRINRGEVSLSTATPFSIVDGATKTVEFTPGYPVAEAVFRVHLPEGCAGGEVETKAVFRVDGTDIATGSVILGVTPDWYTTGPLTPGDPRCRQLRNAKHVSPSDLREGWEPYPDTGYDRYRRLDFEKAFGQMHDRFVFLYTEIQVDRAGDFLSFLTIDDCGYVFIDGQRIAGRSEEGVGEGWMMVDKVSLPEGRHSVFAWVYQADFAEPVGRDAGRHTPNHWNLKWLLRQSRHAPASGIASVPVGLAREPEAAGQAR